MRLELRAAHICEQRFLPLVGSEVPVAGSGFVIIAAGAVDDGWSAPVIHSHLQQGAGRNLDAGFYGATFEVSRRKCGSWRGTPEMPDAIGTLSDWQHDRMIRVIIS